MGFTKIGDPKEEPEIVGLPSNTDPNQVPRISETPI